MKSISNNYKPNKIISAFISKSLENYYNPSKIKDVIVHHIQEKEDKTTLSLEIYTKEGIIFKNLEILH